METVFKSEKDITNEWLTYLESEVQAMSNQNELEIESYMDREVLNPQVQGYLTEDFDDEDDQGSFEPMALKMSELAAVGAQPAFFRFRRFKRKVRKIFCEIVDELQGLSWKDIIKALLLALIPAFAGGVPAIVLPIVIALVAIFVSKGVAAVCPV